VDPLGGLCDPLDHGEGLTVNIALVEDGMPICGVVYAPVTDTVYYAQTGKSSFRLDKSGVPQKLGLTDNGPAKARPCLELASGLSSSAEERESSYKTSRPKTPCRGLAICRVADGTIDSYRCTTPSAEWETAAGHVIANCAGKRVCDSSSNEELRYNKANLINGPFAVW
jgi:3'(2'), 5'-bisphosphate nucleotidase